MTSANIGVIGRFCSDGIQLFIGRGWHPNLILTLGFGTPCLAELTQHGLRSAQVFTRVQLAARYTRAHERIAFHEFAALDWAATGA